VFPYPRTVPPAVQTVPASVSRSKVCQACFRNRTENQAGSSGTVGLEIGSIRLKFRYRGFWQGLKCYGVVNYYRQFIQDCSRLRAPLSELTKKGVVWRWGERQEKAFQQLKQALQGGPVLALPQRGRSFKVRCDWSRHGVGGVLLQKDEEGVERVIAYGSRSCNPAESRYSNFEGELLAAVYFLRLWRQYLYGERFVLESDHQPPKWILTNSKLTGKLARWALMLSEFDFEVKHGAGVDNEMDCLSRYPQVSDKDCTRVWQEGELDGVAAPIWSASACLSC
jgi:hypothetical protein